MRTEKTAQAKLHGGEQRGPLVSVLTDVHFWVPAGLLLAGLLLLRFIR